MSNLELAQQVERFEFMPLIKYNLQSTTYLDVLDASTPGSASLVECT